MVYNFVQVVYRDEVSALEGMQTRPIFSFQIYSKYRNLKLLKIILVLYNIRFCIKANTDPHSGKTKRQSRVYQKFSLASAQRVYKEATKTKFRVHALHNT